VNILMDIVVVIISLIVIVVSIFQRKYKPTVLIKYKNGKKEVLKGPILTEKEMFKWIDNMDEKLFKNKEVASTSYEYGYVKCETS